MKKIALLFIVGSFAFTYKASAQRSSNDKIHERFPKAGEWPAFRRTGTLEAHSPLKGNITNPGIAWKQFVGALESRMVVESSGGTAKLNFPGDEIKLSGADSIPLAD